MAVQAALAGEELSSGIAFVMLTQALGPTITLTLFNVLFTTSLKSGISQNVPHADATAIINAGATAFRNIVDPADLAGVLRAYADSLNHVFYRKKHPTPTPTPRNVWGCTTAEVSQSRTIKHAKIFAGAPQTTCQTLSLEILTWTGFSCRRSGCGMHYSFVGHGVV